MIRAAVARLINTIADRVEDKRSQTERVLELMLKLHEENEKTFGRILAKVGFTDELAERRMALEERRQALQERQIHHALGHQEADAARREAARIRREKPKSAPPPLTLDGVNAAERRVLVPNARLER
jgi:hypothetical protein